MVGIYKIENKTNHKIYIGQSNNLERRRREHLEWSDNRIGIDIVIKNIGPENFTFEILEECSQEELNEKEKYWIEKYNSFENGYNQTRGGQGEYCGHPKLTYEDVKNIRIAYSQRKKRDEVYKEYQDIITKDGFYHIWQGNRWTYIMPEVYTDENREWYKNLGKFNSGETHPNAKLSNEEVIKIRERYVNETAKSIWEDYKEFYTLDSFKQILQGVKYSTLPIYKKQQKKWINI